MASILFRIVVGLNFIRFALSFSPAFEGTGEINGIADRLFNPNHHFGFRLDFVWLVISTVAIVLATVVFIRGIEKDRRARINVILGLTWSIAFAVYMARSLTSGILSFG
jgi:hypothetical protein